MILNANMDKSAFHIFCFLCSFEKECSCFCLFLSLGFSVHLITCHDYTTNHPFAMICTTSRIIFTPESVWLAIFQSVILCVHIGECNPNPPLQGQLKEIYLNDYVNMMLSSLKGRLIVRQ